MVAICVGAMFSSGFFLLPGLAFSYTGPSVFLAYACSGLLLLPTMISQAELCTAMPKAGGSYFFLDRAFGPLVGTIGGMGVFLGLVLKTAFALIGFGAYLQLYTTIPSKTIAIGLGLLFVVLNLLGAKESGKLQKILVAILVIAMSLFIFEGLRAIVMTPLSETMARFDGFFSNGFSQFFYTMAFVFVSYAGLTKVSSVSEEVKDPERNIPLGLAISLCITTVIYGLGVFVVVALVPSAQLMGDLKPIATAEQYMFDWVQGSIGLLLVTLAALMAFASTGNAGILAASRYPLAMAKDKLIPNFFSQLNRFGVPGRAILFTGVLMLVVILCLSEAGIAKLASSFQLFLFVLLNFSVIVMRESKISTYDPGFKSPCYPWMQLFGVFISLALLIYMGTTILAFLLVMVVVFYLWYVFYAAKRVSRDGAIFHWFANLGRRQFDFLEEELWDIMKEKGVRENDPMDQILSRATIIDLKGHQSFEALAQLAAETLSRKSDASLQELREGFLQKAVLGAMPVSSGLSMAGLRLIGATQIELVAIRCPDGFDVQLKDVHGDTEQSETGRLALFLMSPEFKAKMHLRLMASWIGQAEDNHLVEACMVAEDEQGVRDQLGTNGRLTYVMVVPDSEYAHWIDQKISEIDIPGRALIPLIIRSGQRIIPDGRTVIEKGDRVVLIDSEGEA